MQSQNKENAAAPSLGGRKISGSFNAGSGIGRPGQPRRRETSDSINAGNPLSPTSERKFFRDDAPISTPTNLVRRRTDLKDDSPDTRTDVPERDAQPESNSFGPLKRSTTGPLNTALGGPSASPWSAGPQSAAFASMGAFGSFAVGPTGGPADVPEKRPNFGGMRGESRFKGLLSKTSAEDMSPSVREKSSISNLGRVPELEGEVLPMDHREMPRTRTTRSETNPFGDSIPRSGSAALTGDQDSPPSQSMDQFGFQAFGIPNSISGRDFVQSGQETLHQTPQSRQQANTTLSPTNTNPYQSPEGDRMGQSEGHDINPALEHGFGHPNMDHKAGPFGSMRARMATADDRSQTSSSGTSRPFGGIGVFGGLSSTGGSSAWPSSATPTRERGAYSGFGDSLFGPLSSDVQSPHLGGLGGGSFFGSPLTGPGPIGRQSKLGPLFPPAMQDQMRGDRPNGDNFDRMAEPDLRGQQGFGDNFGRRRDVDRSSHTNSFFSENGDLPQGQQMRANDEVSQFDQQSGFVRAPSAIQSMAPGAPKDPNNPAAQNLSQSSGSNSSNQLPAAQQRQMVMPDRMRWIYRDPQGNTQGPWSGLEMHDWFKAGFFTAELQVKKLEDVEYEPLAQLVRRIGNSREPFLVPQIGVPHGPAAPQGNSPWSALSPTAPPSTAATGQGSAQPPFASSFPSFGTTLTAEQQNALERRKQEEQYLMARQKEHLAQQQVLMKQMQLQGGAHGMHSLQHHSSAHSLHSQPSFGSITSPTGYQPSPIQGPIQPPQNVPGFFEGMRQQVGHQSSAEFRSPREEELPGMMDRMSLPQRGQYPFGAAPLGAQLQESGPTQAQIHSMLQQRARLQEEQQAAGDVFPDGNHQSERVQEFLALRTLADSEEEMNRANEGTITQPIGPPLQATHVDNARIQTFGGKQLDEAAPDVDNLVEEPEKPSLARQVQKAARSAQKTQIPEDSTWNKTDQAGLAQATPPHSASPLLAPSAQRNHQKIADTLAAESRSPTQTPVETLSASIAPWADRSVETVRGPSLKEIQEAETRRAAEQAKILAAQRKVQAEQDYHTQAAAPTVAPGLPSTSTWGSTASPITPVTPTASIWGKGGNNRAVSSSTTATKKTLAQIQAEEEKRKQKAAAETSAKLASSMPVPAGGKRYAELASKVANPQTAAPTAAWTTVGSSGKAKIPPTVVAAPQVQARAVSSASTTVPPVARPAAQTARSSVAGSTNKTKAIEELKAWSKGSLGKGLHSTINGKSRFLRCPHTSC